MSKILAFFIDEKYNKCKVFGKKQIIIQPTVLLIVRNKLL